MARRLKESKELAEKKMNEVSCKIGFINVNCGLSYRTPDTQADLGVVTQPSSDSENVGIDHGKSDELGSGPNWIK